MSQIAIELREINRKMERLASQYRRGNMSNAELLKRQANLQIERDEIESRAPSLPEGAAGDWWGI